MPMKIEVRADGAHISGYVNATGKKSRPVMTPHGRCIEVIEPRAFEKALEKGGDIGVTIDHDGTHIYARTDDGTCTLYEDAIGLHADVLIKDPTVIELAKTGRIRGWSFGMFNVEDTIEPRAEGELPIRHITGMELDHITLVVNKLPVYSATSVELRADAEHLLEERGSFDNPQITVEAPSFDYAAYKARLNAIKH